MAQNNRNTDYVRLAYALALSLRASQHSVKNISIGITPGTTIPERYEWVFDQVIEVPWGDDAFDEDWKLENEWKVIHMSPYDETIKLDADMLFFGDISTWWDSMTYRDFHVCNRVVDYRLNTITGNYYRQVFKENQLPNIYTAFMYFKKTPKTFELFKLAEALFVNWHVFSEVCLGYKHRPEKPSTDVVFALALKLLDIDQVWHTESQYPTFVHMKTKLQGWQDDSMGEDWLRHIDVFINKHLECKIGNHRQFYPLHYHVKEFMTDDIIEMYERYDTSNGRHEIRSRNG